MYWALSNLFCVCQTVFAIPISYSWNEVYYELLCVYHTDCSHAFPPFYQPFHSCNKITLRNEQTKSASFIPYHEVLNRI